MSDVIESANSITEYPIEVKRMAYIMFRNESANGKSGVNNNYIGFQSDSGRWQSKYDKYFVGVCIRKENSAPRRAQWHY